jgi:AraC-like DNA-binding protein
MRTCFEQSPTAPRWYQASSDPRLSPALHAIHAGHPWTVPELASLSGLPRPAFARNFERSLGQAPMQYLTDWRMTLARDYLRTGELALAQIANRTSYASPNAFAAAFRRHHGQPPASGRKASWPDRLSPFMVGEARRSRLLAAAPIPPAVKEHLGDSL